MGDLSPHFSWDEALASEAAEELGLDNSPLPKHRKNIETASAPLMEQVRRACGNRAVVATSWYRAPPVNKAVGGVSNSAHPQGYGVDFRVAGQTPLQSARLILADKTIKFDQLIWEKSRGVLHISADPQRRMQVLTQPNGPGTKTLPGLALGA
jgi:zinc D-Ala-D-Ala carboxypeptidase